MIEYKVKAYKNGHKSWFLNGEVHREDGPAIDLSDGRKEWWLNGKLHREDGPAVEWSNGHKSWWLNGKLHRKDGPAIEGVDGSKAWWLNGKRYTEEEYRKALNPVKEFTVSEISELLGYDVKIIK